MSNVQIYLGTDLLDFNGVINVKRQVNDYRDPEIGASNKSYTLDIPLTPSNQVLLKYINDIRSREQVTDEARILADGIEVIRGKLRILNYGSLSVKGIVEADDWVDEIAETNINDLSWAGGDEHSFTAAVISGSWALSAGALYRYPLINFGEIVSGDFGLGGSDLYPYDFYPMWSAEHIVTKLLADGGYTLAPNGFFAGTFGQTLYVLSAGKPAVDNFIIDKQFKGFTDDNADNFDTIPLAASATYELTVAQLLVMTGEDVDEGNDYNAPTTRYTAPVDGTYRFQIACKIHSDGNLNPGSYTINGNDITLSIKKNGATTMAAVTDTGITIFNAGNSFSVDAGYIHLDAGDYVEGFIDISCDLTNDTGGELDPELYVKSGVDDTYLQLVWDNRCLWPGIGKVISPSEYLPEIVGLGFLQGLRQAFNLRFFSDRLNRTVYIETSNDFYGSTVIDWTDKIDYSAGVTQEIIAASYEKVQRFSWKPDGSDKAYRDEVASNGVPLRKELTLESEYAKGGMLETPNRVFSPTPLGQMPQIGHGTAYIIPRIFGSEEYVSAARQHPQDRPKSWSPRLLEWNGLVSLGSGAWDYLDDIAASSGAAHTDFPSASTPDMADMYSDHMLKDWRRVDLNRIVTCTLNLTPGEIMQFMTVVGTAANEGFRATYRLNIEGVDMYFIINKITTDGDQVKCELVQKL